MASGAAIVAGVAGAPIAHSLSPFLHGRWIAAAGIDAAYVPFAPAVDGFARFVDGLRGGAIVGVNVTAPFKREALALADRADAAATACGSANLLLFHADGSIEARSTDGHGVVTALARHAPRQPCGRAVVLGAGGAGAAAAAALVSAGWQVTLVNRTRAAADAVAARTGAAAADWETLALNVEAADLLVNALAVAPPPMPLDPAMTVLDMGYRPHWTPLLRAAQAAGASVVHGIDMLIAQAEPSFGAFFGRPPPVLSDLRAEAVALAG